MNCSMLSIWLLAGIALLTGACAEERIYERHQNGTTPIQVVIAPQKPEVLPQEAPREVMTATTGRVPSDRIVIMKNPVAVSAQDLLYVKQGSRYEFNRECMVRAGAPVRVLGTSDDDPIPERVLVEYLPPPLIIPVETDCPRGTMFLTTGQEFHTDFQQTEWDQTRPERERKNSQEEIRWMLRRGMSSGRLHR